MRINKAALDRLTPEQRKDAEERIKRVKEAYEANPLLRYKPHAGQPAYHEITTPIGVVSAGNRFGKTTCGIVHDLIQLCDEEAVPDWLKPYKRWDPKEHGPIKGRIAAPKFKENIRRVVLPTVRQWAPRGQLVGGSFDDAYKQQENVLYFKNGSTLQFLTYDQDVDAHAGDALHFVHFDEEPEGDKGYELYVENMTRLGDFDGDFRMTMTPLFGMSWAYDEIIVKANSDPRISLIYGDTYANPHVNRERLRADEALLTREERQARRQGKFVHFAGLFYPEFGEDHWVDPPKAAHVKDQSIVVGIDPGLNFTGVVWVAFDNDNVALVFDEIKPEQMIVEEVAKRIHEVNKLWGIEPDYYVIDPSARNRSTINAQDIESAYLRAGVPTIHGQNARGAGILEVKRRLQVGPGLLVSRTCTQLADEFAHYRKDPNSQDEFAAIKKNDHLVDALRYVCMERSWGIAEPAANPEPERWTPGTAPSEDWFSSHYTDSGALV